MKKFGIILCSLLITFLGVLYLGFLFVLPNVVDLNQYKSKLQKLVKEQIPLNVDFKNAKLVTTPMLSIGVKAEGLSVKFEDGSTLFSADSAKLKFALPSLLTLTVKIPTLEVNNPILDFRIIDGKQFKILMLVENILQSKEDNFDNSQKEVSQNLLFDTSIIRIKIPNIKLNNYKVSMLDEKTGHDLKVKGDCLKIGYFNGKVLKVKTDAEFYSDENKNIDLKVDINSFLPQFETLDEEDDKPQRIELPFINPVLAYRQYDLKTNVATKLKIRDTRGLIKLNGFVNIDDTTLKLADYNLQKCYFHGKFKGTKANIDTNFAVAKDKNIKLLGLVDYGKNPKIDMSVNSDRIYFQDLITVFKAYLDSLHIKNDLAYIKGLGYIEANAKVKSNFKKLESEGKIIVRNGSVINKLLNLGITKTNANFLFDNNSLNVIDTYTYINDAPLKISGHIDRNSISDIKVTGQKIPISGLYNAFAPNDIKKSLNVNKGYLTLNGDIKGQLKNVICKSNISLQDFLMSASNNTLRVLNQDLNIDVNVNKNENFQKITIKNSNLNIQLPKVGSKIVNKSLLVDIFGSQLKINPTEILINNNSKVTIDGLINSEKENPVFKINGSGSLNSLDLKKFFGPSATPFIDAKGKLPLKLNIDGNMKRQNLVLRIFASPQNYISPVKLSQLMEKESVLQAKIDFKGDRLKIKQTGLFIRTNTTDEKGNVIEHLEEIIGVNGTIVALKSVPFINIIKITIPNGLTGSIQGFRNSNFNLNGKMFIFGSSKEPRIHGKINVDKFFIRDFRTTLNSLVLDFKGRLLNVDLQNLIINGSNFYVNFNLPLLPSSLINITDLEINSDIIDVDKLFMVATTANRMFSAKGKVKVNPSSAQIPFTVKNSSANLRYIKSGNIQLQDVNSRVALNRNMLYINNLRAKAFKGHIYGRMSMNLLTNILRVKVGGDSCDMEKLLRDAAGMRDTLSGKLAFISDISINAGETNYNRQLKSLRGNVRFSIKNGQFGPFGKLENLILAENIRDSQFFQTTIGGILNDLTSIDTTHYKDLKGSLTFKNGIVQINPITSEGKVLNLYIAGDFNLLQNTVDMKVRARMLSMLSNVLGPIASINPVNLVKVTPGLNIASAKLFTLFTQPVTQEELNKIPAFSAKTDNINATNFQIIVKGDVNKPLKLVKSFKWLALQNQIDNANSFVSSLPEPETINSTVEEAEAQQLEDEKLKSKIKKVFFKKEQKEQELQKQQTHELMQKMKEDLNSVNDL